MKKNSIKQLTMHKAQLTIIAALIMLTAWACTNDDSEALSQAPVSITANVAGVVTRATADIKTAFYPGDQIKLTVGTTDYTATLAGDGTWQTDFGLSIDGFIPPITATYDGPDPLTATASTTDGNMNLTVDPTTGEPVWNITLNFTHTRAVVDVVVFDPQMNNITTQMQSITLGGVTSTSPNDILLEPTTAPNHIGSVTVRVGGIPYTANTTAALLANTRYTIAFICDPVKPTVTITSTTWGTGETGVAPIGYDYIISNLAELKEWHADMTATGVTTEVLKRKAIQTANITWDGTEWTPVGTPSDYFMGVYNGNGYTITGLRIGVVSTGYSYQSGMFGNIGSVAVLTGIHLRDAKCSVNNVDMGNKIGLLVGTAQRSSTISLCSVQGSLTADGWYMAGGLVGYNEAGHITRCYADVTITHTFNRDNLYTGGLVGSNDGTIVACGASGNITTTNATTTNMSAYAGGLAGDNYGTIYYCYATGNVSISSNENGVNCAGGLVGRLYSGKTIAYSYATGNATGPDTATTTTGSLVGNSSSTGIITSCHATGTATGGKFVGNMEDDDVKVSNAPGARRTTIAATGDIPPTVRTVQYTPATGYDALNVTSKEFAGADKTTGASLWTTGALPDINYLKYNGE